MPTWIEYRYGAVFECHRYLHHPRDTKSLGDNRGILRVSIAKFVYMFCERNGCIFRYETSIFRRRRCIRSSKWNRVPVGTLLLSIGETLEYFAECLLVQFPRLLWQFGR